MKMFRSWSVVALIFSVLFLTGCNKVPAGHVGILFNLYGTEKGVNEQVVGPGRYWLTPNEDLFLFPTFTQSYVWTKEPVDGDPTDESISFQSVEGLVFNADVGISYAIQKDKVAVIFQKYRKGVEEITDIILRNMVRDALVAVSSNMTSEQIYGSGRTKLIEEVQKIVQAQVLQYGIVIEKISWIGQLRLDPKLQAAINAKIEATQIAMQRENEVATAKAEAAKEVERATGEANGKLLIAEAEAKAIKIRAEALRSNPELVELVKAEAQKDAVQKWNGVLPTQMIPGTAVPMLNIR